MNLSSIKNLKNITVHCLGSITPFEVQSLSGVDRFGMPYRFVVEVKSADSSIAIDTLILTNATISMQVQGVGYGYSGIITGFEYLSTNVDYSLYRLVIEPRAIKSAYSKHSRVFCKRTATDIITALLDGVGLTGMYRMQCTRMYEEIEYVAQYNESDFNFLCRLMERSGSWMLFEEPPAPGAITANTGGIERLIIADSTAGLKPLTPNPVLRQCGKGGFLQILDGKDIAGISMISTRREMVPKEVFVKDYQYATPEMDVSGKATIEKGNAGTVYHYGGNLKNAYEAESAAKNIAGHFIEKQSHISGRSDCMQMRAGMTFVAVGSEREDANGMFLITEVIHRAKTGYDNNGQRRIDYENEFRAIPQSAMQQYRPEIGVESTTVPGVVSAKIESIGSDYAYLDEKGRYKLKMNFDREKTAPCNGSNFIRQLQASAGSCFGAHLPSHDKIEMVMAHYQGNPDRPVCLGTAPDANNRSPVSSSNITESVIRSAANNEIVLDDSSGKEKISLFAERDHTFATANDLKVNIGGDRIIDVANNEKCIVEKDLTLKVSGDQTVTVEGNGTKTVEGSYSHTAKKDSSVAVHGKSETTVAGDWSETVRGDRTKKVQSDSSFTVNGDLSMEVTGNWTNEAYGAMSFKSDISLLLKSDTTLTVDAPSIVLDAEACTTIRVGASSINITPACITLTAVKLTVSGKEINTAGGFVNTFSAGLIKIN